MKMKIFFLRAAALASVLAASGCKSADMNRLTSGDPTGPQTPAPSTTPAPSGTPDSPPDSPKDTVAPTIANFSIPLTSSSLTVGGIVLQASDAVGVTGYFLSETAGTPAAASGDWKASTPSSFTFSGEGQRDLYAWAKDAAGNISGAANARTTITLSNPVTAIFSESFDTQPDWSPAQIPGGRTCITGQNCAVSVPSGFYDYRVAGTEGCSNVDGNHNTININGLHPRGGTGKSFLMWNEPCYSSGGSWGSDGLLGVHFAPRKEVYVRYWIQFQPDWVWAVGGSSPMQKFLHMSHLSPELSPLWDFFGGIQNKPRFTPQLAKFGGGTYRIQFNLPHSPLTAARDSSASFNTNVYFGDSPLDWTTPGTGGIPAPGDGNWHSFEFYANMNTQGQADGSEKVWFDGKLVNTTSGIAWVPAGDNPDLWQWNHVWLGGNNSNLYTPQDEQWYAVDDFVVADHYSGPPPRPSVPTLQKLGSTSVRVSWTAGTNGASYILDGYRVYYGTAADQLTSTVEAGTSTTIDIPGLQAGQTYYFAVTGHGQAAYDANENESLKSPVVSVFLN